MLIIIFVKIFIDQIEAAWSLPDIEEAIAVDLSPGNSSCSIHIRTYPVKSLNPVTGVYGYGKKLFNMPIWC